MRACDVRGVEVLDKVFLADPVDTFYAARREHGTIVALGLPRAGGDLLLQGVRHRLRLSRTADVVMLDRRRHALLESRRRRRAEASPKRSASVLEECRRSGRKGRGRPEQEKHPRNRREAAATRTSLSRVGTATSLMEKFDSPRVGGALQAVPWRAAPAPLCAPPASATTSRTIDTGTRRPALPLLGFLHVLRLYDDGRTATTERAQMRALPSALHAQARVLPGEQRRACIPA